MELLERALTIVGDQTFYVEARVGSQNHRGECCRVLWQNARNNEAADVLIPLLVSEITRLRAAAISERERVVAIVESRLPADYGYAQLTRADLIRCDLLVDILSEIRPNPAKIHENCADKIVHDLPGL